MYDDTQTLREMYLPTDLHSYVLSKISSYHYVSGVDASSSASLAAYLNSLTYAVDEQSSWFSSKSALWKVRGGTYWLVMNIESFVVIIITVPRLLAVSMHFRVSTSESTSRFLEASKPT